MSLEMASISMSFDLDTSGLMSGAGAFSDAFDQIDASARGMGSDIDSVLDQIEANLKSTTTGTTMLSDGMGDVGVAAAKASGALRETGTAAAQTGAAMSIVDDASTQVAAAMAAIDNSANSAASGMLQTGTAADAAEAGIRSAGTAAERAGQSIQQIDDAAAQASRGLNKGSTDAERFGAAVMRLETQINTVGFGLAGFGAAVGAGIALAVAEFVRFEAAMRNVNSIAGLTDDALAQLSDQVLELSSRVGQGPTKLAEGLYDIQSSGFEAAEGLQILEKAAIAATAGLTDTGTSARAITAVLNAYGKSASEAGDVSDLLFSIVDKGVITFENLANNLGTVLPVASALRVPFEQIAAAYAQLTLNGISAAQAETALAAALRSAINPTEQLTAAVQQAGFESAEMAVQAVGLSGYLQILMQASGGSSEALSQLLGTAEATTAVLALMNDGGAGLTAMMGEMSAAMTDGAYAQSVFNEQAKSTQFTLQQLGVALTNAKVLFGAAFAPLITFGAQGLIAVIDGISTAFSALPDPVQQAMAGLTGFTAVLAVATGGAALAAPRIVETVAAFRKLREESVLLQRTLALLGRVSPLLLGLTAIGAIVGAGIGLWNKYTKNVDESAEAMKRLEEATQATTDIISRLNLSGNWELAKMVSETFHQVEETIIKFNENVPKLFSDVNWFANEIDFSQMGGDEYVAAFTDFLNKDVGGAFIKWAEKTHVLGENTNTILEQALAGNVVTINQYGGQIQEAVRGYLDYLVIDENDKSEITTSLNSLFDLFSNPNIDASKLNAVIMGYVSELANGTITSDQFDQKLKDLHTSLAEGNDIWGIYTESLADMTLQLADMSAQMAQLRLNGMGDVAYDMKQVELAIEGAAAGWTVTNYALDETTGRMTFFTEQMQLTEDQLKDLQVIGETVMQALGSGLYDNERLMAAFNEAMSAETPLQRLGQLYILMQEMPTYTLAWTDSINGATAAIAGGLNTALNDTARLVGDLGPAILGVAGDIALAESEAYQFSQTIAGIGEGLTSAGADAAQAQADALQEYNDATIEWLANGDNILSFLNRYISESNVAAQASIDMAMALQQSGAQMDAMLSLFGEIDNLAQRSSNANSIADNLIGAPGELGTLQDLWGRIIDGTSVATLEAWEYEAALQAGLDIQQSNARVQDYITQIQAQQIPLLRDQQIAYEENLRALSEMNAAEQQRAIYLQSSAGQAEVASAYSTAYAASIGELPKSVATELIANDVQANPVLRDTLMNLGLIREGANGEIIVNFPDGPTVQEAIQDLTAAIDDLIYAMTGVKPLRVTADVDGAVNNLLMVRDLLTDEQLKRLEDLRGKVTLEGADEATTALEAFRRGLGITDETEATADVGVNDNITGILGRAVRDLAGVDGTVAEATAKLNDQMDLEAILTELGYLDNTEAEPSIILDDKSGATRDLIDAWLTQLGGTTTTHTVVFETIGGGVADAAGRAAEGAQQPEEPQPDRGQMNDFGMQGPPPIVMPAIDTTLFDASVVALGATYQQLLTATNATFVVAIPANITAGMQGGSSAIYGEITVWQLHFGANLQPILTVVNAVFVTAIPLNILTGMQLGSANISLEAGTWSGLIDAVAPAMGSAGLNAGSVGGYGAANGIAAAKGQISSNVGVWPGIIDGIAGAMGSNGFNAGASAGYGVANGIASAEGAAVAAATSLANAVNAALNAVIQPGSPSKVTTKLGKTIPAGLVVGMESGEADVYAAASRLGNAVLDGYNETMAKGKWYDPRAGGNQGGSPLEPEPGNGGNMPNPPTPTPPDEDAWKKEIVGGLTGALTDAMKNAGLEFDKSAGSIFSKEEWESGMRLKDLFTGRTRVSDTGFLFGNGKYLEEYLGGLFPDEATAPYPPGTPPDPTTPPRPGTGPLQPEYGQVGPKRSPDRPNTGGRSGYGSRTEIHYHQEDQRTTTMYTPEPERFTEYLVKARNGDTAYRAARNVGTNRTLTHGVRSTPGRY